MAWREDAKFNKARVTRLFLGSGKGVEVTVTAAEINAVCGAGLLGWDTWDPGNIASGAEEAKEVTVTGAALGDFALASFTLDVTDLVLNAQVTAADTVTCVLANNTGGAVNLGSGTVRVIVWRL